MNFAFGSLSERTPLELSGATPYMEPTMRARVAELLAAGCYCRHDAARTATLRRRNIGGSVCVWLQCDACGASLGSALARALHPKWQSYPLWDQGLADTYARAQDEHRRALPTYEDRLAQREADYAARSAHYEEWCRTAPEWHAIVKLVAWRSRGHCEACLSAPSEVVHHLTYDFGKLPPAWHLRAVCRLCHTRLHTRGDDWCDYGMGRGADEPSDASE